MSGCRIRCVGGTHRILRRRPGCSLRSPNIRGIFINGREIDWGYEAPEKGLRKAIVQALRG